MVNFRPLRNNVVVEREEEEEKTDSGIYLPQERQYQTSKARGVVVAVGPAVADVAVGDRVIYGLYAGREESEYTVLKEDEILCVFT